MIATTKYKTYVFGATIRLKARFRVHTALTDPTTIIVTVKKPDDALAEYTYPADVEIVRDSVGVFHIGIVGDQEGQWYYRIEGTGAASGVGEHGFCVEPSLVIES